jgi:hypothetical protein
MTKIKITMILSILCASSITAFADAKEDAITKVEFWGRDVTTAVAGYGTEYGKSIVEGGKKCSALVTQALAEGADGATTIETKQLGTITLAEADAKVCQPTIVFGTAWQRIKDELEKGNYEERAAPYRKLGAKGELLDVLVEYHETGLYGKGCKRIDSPAQRMKAKVWYEFLEGNDGTWSLRTFKIKGSKVHWDTVVYQTESAAVRACRR